MRIHLPAKRLLKIPGTGSPPAPRADTSLLMPTSYLVTPVPTKRSPSAIETGRFVAQIPLRGADVEPVRCGQLAVPQNGSSEAHPAALRYYIPFRACLLQGRPPPTGTRRSTGGRPPAARMPLIRSAVDIGSPFVMKYALPANGAPGAKRSPANTWAAAALSTYTESIRLGRFPSRAKLPRLSLRPESAAPGAGSPGPQIRCGRKATVAKFESFAPRTCRSRDGLGLGIVGKKSLRVRNRLVHALLVRAVEGSRWANSCRRAARRPSFGTQPRHSPCP